jgi:PAS domain S-box-containing protein
MPGKRLLASRKHSHLLRQRAEELLRAKGPDISGMAVEDIQTLLHELQVHQIELELQNEELRQAQVELAESRDRYSDLYEFAPVGHLTLDEKGRIIESNLTAAGMLGVDRTAARGSDLSRFVDRESQDQLYFHLQAVFAGDRKQICELVLNKKDGTTPAVRLESIIQQSAEAVTRRCRTALIDITDVREIRQQLQHFNEELEQRVK